MLGAEIIDWKNYRRIVVLTGSGVSAASGLPTYRGKGGLWEKVKMVELATAEAIYERPHDVWAFFSRARAKIAKSPPNTAHEALAQIEARVHACGGAFCLLTQNVDGIHQRAGSQEIIELHGSVTQARCSDPGCDLASFVLKGAHLGKRAPACPRCTAPLRPDVVLFGEMLPPDAEKRAKAAVDSCDLFIAVGTSGSVYPAASYIRRATHAGARTILINLEVAQPQGASFDEIYIGRAEELLPLLLRS